MPRAPKSGLPGRRRWLAAVLRGAGTDFGATGLKSGGTVRSQRRRGGTMKTSDASQGLSASAMISQRIADLGGWRGEALARMRNLIKETDPDVVEEWKWMGTPVWSHDGIICTGESYKT